MTDIPEDAALVEVLAPHFAGGIGKPLGYFSNGLAMRPATWADQTDETKEEARKDARAALSALRAAGYEVRRADHIAALDAERDEARADASQMREALSRIAGLALQSQAVSGSHTAAAPPARREEV